MTGSACAGMLHPARMQLQVLDYCLRCAWLSAAVLTWLSSQLGADVQKDVAERRSRGSARRRFCSIVLYARYAPLHYGLRPALSSLSLCASPNSELAHSAGRRDSACAELSERTAAISLRQSAGRDPSADRLAAFGGPGGSALVQLCAQLSW
jgi:hypothetical protein